MWRKRNIFVTLIKLVALEVQETVIVKWIDCKSVSLFKGQEILSIRAEITKRTVWEIHRISLLQTGQNLQLEVAHCTDCPIERLSNTKLSWTKEVFGLSLQYCVCSFPAGIIQTFPIAQTDTAGEPSGLATFQSSSSRAAVELNFIHNKWSIYPKILPLQLAVPHQPLRLLVEILLLFSPSSLIN